MKKNTTYTHRRSWFTTWSRLTLKRFKTILEIWNLFHLCVQFYTLTFGPGFPIGPRSPFAPIKPWGVRTCTHTHTQREKRDLSRHTGHAWKKMQISSFLQSMDSVTQKHKTISLIIPYLIETGTALAVRLRFQGGLWAKSLRNVSKCVFMCEHVTKGLVLNIRPE